MDGRTERSCLMRDFNGGGGEQKNVRSNKGSSRNKSGKVLAKKPPQRGLGVAQLERLRIQERWKKMTEFDGGTQSHENHQFHQFPFQEQQNIVSSVPMIAAVAGFASPMNIIKGQQQQQKQICNSAQPSTAAANFVLNPYRSVGGNGGSSAGNRSVFSDHHVQFRAGNGNLHFHQQQQLSFETAAAAAPKELSSSQKSSHCLFDQCDVCLKKKRMIINGENLGFEGGGRSSAQYLERKSFDGCDFLGLDLGRNWTTVNGHNQRNEFSVRRASYSSEITTNINDDQEEVEVVAIHRKGKTSIGGGGGGSSSTSVLMEYDFFPRKASSSSSSTRSSRSVMIKKENVSLFGDQASSVLVGESSSSTSSSATTNLLDLSLKLSC